MGTLLDYLKDQKISQRAFARSVGVDPSIISRLAHRSMRPSLDLAVTIERQTGGRVRAASWIEPVPLPSPVTAGGSDVV
ncbi:helix-turn-helix domain-containing protein [Loktanella agnita]|uniref:helix-turn-helix domain-containing protein n=1 Tax=Loktanella agnita TaxID=287097 RepID=UPI00398753DD